MKRALFAFVAAAILVAFTAPSFAGDDKKKEEKKGGHFSQTLFGDDKKKEEKMEVVSSHLKITVVLPTGRLFCAVTNEFISQFSIQPVILNVHL